MNQISKIFHNLTNYEKLSKFLFKKIKKNINKNKLDLKKVENNLYQSSVK